MAWPITGSVLPTDKVYNEGLGFVTQTFPMWAVQGTTSAGASGEMRAASIGMRAGTVVNNIVIRVTTASASLTLARFAIYSSAYSLLASSASVHASLNGATGFFSAALSAPYAIPSSGLYYLAALYVGTTPPTVMRGSAVSGSSIALGSGPVAHFVQASLADLPSTATPAANTNFLWFGAT